MKNTTRRSWIMSLLFAASALAQSGPPTIRVSSFYTVKSDRVGDFLAATKEYATAVKEGGSERSFNLWMSLSGEREYVLVRHHRKWAEMDETLDPKLKDIAPRLSAITSRIMSCVESYHRVISQLDSDLSLPLPTGTPQPMARVLRTWVKSEKLAEYRTIVKNELLPAARKAGLTLYSVSHPRFGGSNFQIDSVSGVANWAELDGEAAIITALGGQDAYQKFLARIRPLVNRSEYQMYRWMKDQSYTPSR
jgi:hypothetical protein